MKVGDLVREIESKKTGIVIEKLDGSVYPYTDTKIRLPNGNTIWRHNSELIILSKKSLNKNKTSIV